MRVFGVGSIYGNNVSRNRRITEIYAQQYNLNTDAYKWAGNASFASYLVGDSLSEAYKWMQATGTLAQYAPINPATGYDLLSEGNQVVYDDLMPQHLAFETAGLVEILALPFVAAAQKQGWTSIDNGLNTQNSNLVWQGNNRLLEHEQNIVLQNSIYNQSLHFWDTLSNSWNPVIPPIASPIPGHNVTFQDYRPTNPNIPNNASIANAQARWAWIINSVVPAWMQWSNNHQGALQAATLLSGGYHP